MNRSLADFSKGRVIPKYQIVEVPKGSGWRSWIHFFGFFSWICLWLYVGIKFDQQWPFFLAVAIIFFQKRMNRAVLRWYPTGILTLTDEAMIVERSGNEEVVPWSTLSVLHIWTIAPSSMDDNAHYPQYAQVVRLRVKASNGLEEFAALNEMHLTAEDKLQFMEPPPTLGSLILRACKQHKIKAKNHKGENWSDWFDDR